MAFDMTRSVTRIREYAGDHTADLIAQHIMAMGNEVDRGNYLCLIIAKMARSQPLTKAEQMTVDRIVYNVNI